MNKKLIIIGILVMGAAFAGLVACGGSSYDSGGLVYFPPATAVISRGAMTKGSTILNGVRFEDTYANITADDMVKTPAYLASGMTVRVKGTRNADGVTGNATRIHVEDEARGAVAGLAGGDDFSVQGQIVVVDDRTVRAGGVTFSGGVIGGLANEDNVEVHGERMTDGTILATRVEKFGGAVTENVRGTVANLIADTSFDIGPLTITYTAGTPILPAGAVLANGSEVEVRLSGAAATLITIENAPGGEFEPAEGQHVEIEDYVANYDGVSDFDLGGQHVHLTASTAYLGGTVADIVNDARIEVEGHMTAGVQVAEKVSFRSSMRIIANPDGAGSANVLGITVATTSVTRFDGDRATAGAILAGDELEVRGYANSDGTSMTATRIISKASSAVAKPILQGPVHTISAGPAYTLHILGITVDASAVPASEVKDRSNNIITKDALFAQLVANITVVKVRGTIAGTLLTADKIELE